MPGRIKIESKQVHPRNADLPIFNREHLSRYTMESEALEREIVALFLLQLPLMIDLLKTAMNAAEWKFAIHTLKGSALAIGADRLAEAVRRLEATPFTTGGIDRRLMSVLDRESASFRRRTGRIYR
jgi:hypothetical protein